jgi:hypothetical protein
MTMRVPLVETRYPDAAPAGAVARLETAQRSGAAVSSGVPLQVDGADAGKQNRGRDRCSTR